MTNKAIEYFEKAKEAGKLIKYTKFGKFKVYPTVPGMVVETIIDGQVETKNTAKIGDVLLVGASNERYLLSKAKLKERYTRKAVHSRYDIWEATGTCFAVKYKGKGSFTFKAPWGEDMLCNSGDYICSPTNDNSNDVYRIEEKTFAKTYKEA